MSTDNLRNENGNNIKTPWKEFLKAIERFTDIRTSKKKIFDIYKEGMAVFSELPNCKSCALFTLNENELDFELKIAIPEKTFNADYDLYDYLIESGNIGLALDSASIINVNLENINLFEGSVLIVPLRMSRGINGIVLVVHDNFTEDLNQFLVKLVGVFSNLLGSTLENYQILSEIEKSRATLEQKIATRTIDLAQSRRELKAIFDSVLTGVIVFDLSINKIVRINPIACELIGLPDSEIVGYSVFNFLSYIDYTLVNESNGNSNFHYVDSELTVKGNKKIPILRNTTKLKLNNRVLITESFLDMSKIKEAERTLTHTNQLLEMKVKERTEDLQLIVHKLKQEIIERENAENELRKMFEQQRELSELKTRFVSMVSHEFRTPLTVIKSSAQMITKFDDKLSDSDKNYYLHRVIKSVDNLTDLIENVVFIGKSDANKLSTVKNKFNIEELILNVIDDFKVGINENRRFNLELNNLYGEIYTDDKLVHLIISNLISNSVKYSSSEFDININLGILEGHLIMSIEDFGIGIPEEDQPKVFELFYRAGNVSSIGGTGLGLAVVSESISKLGGRIEMKSKINNGSVFKIFIPLSTMDNN